MRCSLAEKGKTMYKSPIELLITEVTNQIVTEQDEAIFKSVLNYVPNVDRTELIRALQYDRNQYEKGYADGKADAMADLVRCNDCKHCIYISYACGDVRCGKLHTDYITEVSFCSYGERKDNG